MTIRVIVVCCNQDLSTANKGGVLLKITVYRPNQIGGCITEIVSRGRVRILVDVGANLPGVDGEPIDIETLTDGCACVFITHYHGDHIGEYRRVHRKTDIYMGKTAKEIFSTLQMRLSENPNTGVRPEDVSRINQFKTFNHGETIHVNDLSITPIAADHSAFDSYMLLIDDGSRCVLHTGDFRIHGKTGEDPLRYLRKNINHLDALIIEGTMLSRNMESVDTEEELSKKAVGLIKNHKYVFILCSSTNIDRIAAFYHANQAAGNKLFVTDSYQKKVLDVVTENSAAYGGFYDFSACVSFDRHKHYNDMVEKGFCLLVRNNYFSKRFLKSRVFQKGKLFIYSMWKGYLEGKTKDQSISGIVPEDYYYLHTSGHATEEAICAVCGIVNATMIIPIHSERTDRFEELKKEGKITGKIKRLDSGETVEL